MAGSADVVQLRSSQEAAAPAVADDSLDESNVVEAPSDAEVRSHAATRHV